MSKNINWLAREDFMAKAISHIQPADIILDIGTGIVPHDYIKTNLYICFEPYEEYAKILNDKTKNSVSPFFVVFQKNWEEALDYFKHTHVDSIFLIDVIEHLPKEEGMTLLKKTEKIAQKQVVIFTPLGFVEQKLLEGGKDAWGLDGAEWQAHKSGYLPEDFDDSWDIYACKDFHIVNNIGEKLDEPFGALWAIKNINKETSAGETITQARILHNRSLNENIGIISQLNIKLANIITEQENINNQITQINTLLTNQIDTTSKQNSILAEQNTIIAQQNQTLAIQNNELSAVINKLTAEKEQLQLETNSLKQQNYTYQSTINDIHNSKTWKILSSLNCITPHQKDNKKLKP